MKSDFGDEFLPRRATLHSAGYDFYSPKDIEMIPGEEYFIDTGIHLEKGDIAYSQFMMCVPRSGLGFKYGLFIKNTAGIIDSDYFESIKAIISVKEPYNLKKGERFMQGIIIPYGIIANEIVPTAVRDGGIGSTGKI